MEKNWKKIWTTTNPIQAEIMKQMLEEHDVHAVVMNKQISVYNIGSVELYVHEEQEELAVQLLSTHEDLS